MKMPTNGSARWALIIAIIIAVGLSLCEVLQQIAPLFPLP